MKKILLSELIMGIECSLTFFMKDLIHSIHDRWTKMVGRGIGSLAEAGFFNYMRFSKQGVSYLDYRVQCLNRRNGRGPRNIMSTIDMHAVSK